MNRERELSPELRELRDASAQTARQSYHLFVGLPLGSEQVLQVLWDHAEPAVG